MNFFSWDTLWYVLMIMYVPACLGLIVIVLLQKGKGTGFAGAFGMGSGPGSEAVFGPKSGQTLPVKLTYVAAALFMVIAVVMSIIAGKVGRDAAPMLVEEGEESTVTATVALGEYGLGTGVIDASRHSGTASPSVVPISEDQSTESSDTLRSVQSEEPEEE